MKPKNLDRVVLGMLRLFRSRKQLVVITGENPSSTLDNKSHEDSHPVLKSVVRFMMNRKKRDVAVDKKPNGQAEHKEA